MPVWRIWTRNAVVVTWYVRLAIVVWLAPEKTPAMLISAVLLEVMAQAVINHPGV